LTITVSAAVFGDRFTSKAGIGLIVSISGIIFYNYYRLSMMYAKHNDESENSESSISLVDIDTEESN
jgi:hypothetical protein